MTKPKKNAMLELYALFKNGITGKYIANFTIDASNTKEPNRDTEFFDRTVMIIPKDLESYLSNLKQELPRTNWGELRRNYLASITIEQAEKVNSQNLETKAKENFDRDSKRSKFCRFTYEPDGHEK